MRQNAPQPTDLWLTQRRLFGSLAVLLTTLTIAALLYANWSNIRGAPTSTRALHELLAAMERGDIGRIKQLATRKGLSFLTNGRNWNSDTIADVRRAGHNFAAMTPTWQRRKDQATAEFSIGSANLPMRFVAQDGRWYFDGN